MAIKFLTKILARKKCIEPAYELISSSRFPVSRSDNSGLAKFYTLLKFFWPVTELLEVVK